MYTKNFVRERIKEGLLVDASETARGRGFDGGMALSQGAARLGVDEVVAAVLATMGSHDGDAAGMFQLVPFQRGSTRSMLVVELFSEATPGTQSNAALWTVVDLA